MEGEEWVCAVDNGWKAGGSQRMKELISKSHRDLHRPSYLGQVKHHQVPARPFPPRAATATHSLLLLPALDSDATAPGCNALQHFAIPLHEKLRSLSSPMPTLLPRHGLISLQGHERQQRLLTLCPHTSIEMFTNLSTPAK
jgi:hypothetical protein